MYYIMQGYIKKIYNAMSYNVILLYIVQIKYSLLYKFIENIQRSCYYL